MEILKTSNQSSNKGRENTRNMEPLYPDKLVMVARPGDGKIIFPEQLTQILGSKKEYLVTIKLEDDTVYKKIRKEKIPPDEKIIAVQRQEMASKVILLLGGRLVESLGDIRCPECRDKTEDPRGLFREIQDIYLNRPAEHYTLRGLRGHVFCPKCGELKAFKLELL